MIGRNRRYGASRTAKARAAIAAAVVIGGGAAGVAAVASGGHGPVSASSAGFINNTHRHHWMSQSTALPAALTSWGRTQHSRMHSFMMLQNMQPARNFTQVRHHRQQFAMQRGMVLFVQPRHWMVVQSADGQMHLWMLSRHTNIQNVANTLAGTNALLGNSGAALAAMNHNNTNPALQWMAGSMRRANQMVNPAPQPTTITLNVAGTNTTVTITITQGTAKVSQKNTGMGNTGTMTQNLWMQQNQLMHGDMVLVAGLRTHHTLHAQLVLFMPPATNPTGNPTGTASATAAPTGTATATPTPTAPQPTPSSSLSGSGGQHF